jgi:gliding motility-associated-like protein
VLQPSAVTIASSSKVNVLCNGFSTGSVSVQATGGTGTSKTYSINTVPVQTNGTGSFSGLAAGTYTVTARDVYNCSASTTLTITQPPALANSFVTVNVKCFGGNDGRVTITASGGVPPYTYGLPNPTTPLNTSGLFANLTAGTYYGIVTDSNGCLDSTAQIVITQPTQMVYTSVTQVDIECYGQSTGSISVASNQGTGGHSYTIAPDPNSVSPLVGSPQTFSTLPAGQYTITATDANACTINTTVVLLENPEVVFDNITNTEEICYGDGTAVITFSAAGGVGGFTYQFDNKPPYSTKTTYTSLSSGTYHIEVKDALGCYNDTNYTLLGPDRINFPVFEITPTTCMDTEDGKLTVKAAGGRGSVYIYSLEPGFYVNTSGLFRDLPANSYILRTTDTAGCFIDTAVVVSLPANPLVVSIQKVDLGCHGRGNEGHAEAFATGGTPPYQYLWNSSPVQTTAKASGLYQGLHTVDVVDAQGCLVRDTTIIEPGPCCQEVFLPNAFSPNGDGRNDEFRILSTAGMQLEQFEVRNRWGNRIWETTNSRHSWDGTYNGEPVAVGTYHYVLRYKCLTDGQEYIKKGDVTVIR